jgi:hypothetical protein
LEDCNLPQASGGFPAIVHTISRQTNQGQVWSFRVIDEEFDFFTR